MKKQLGKHLIVEFYEVNTELLNNDIELEKILVEAAKRSKSKVIKSVFHKFSPQGVTGIVVIEESHLSIHTWVEYNYAAIDIYTCGNHTIPEKSLEYLVKELNPKKTLIKKIDRGLK